MAEFECIQTCRPFWTRQTRKKNLKNFLDKANEPLESQPGTVAVRCQTVSPVAFQCLSGYKPTLHAPGSEKLKTTNPCSGPLMSLVQGSQPKGWSSIVGTRQLLYPDHSGSGEPPAVEFEPDRPLPVDGRLLPDLSTCLTVICSSVFCVPDVEIRGEQPKRCGVSLGQSGVPKLKDRRFSFVWASFLFFFLTNVRLQKPGR